MLLAHRVEALARLVVREAVREHELEGDLLLEIEMRGSHDDAHPADSQDGVDAVLAGEDVPLLYASCAQV